jgi:hypothetical protein
LGLDDFEPTQFASFTFVAPIGDTLQYAMTFTGAKINFGIAAVLGVIAGAFAAASLAGRFKLEGFTDTNDMLRHMLGGVMMGAGGVLALGCTVGQGITGMSTLALGSVLASLSIDAGGWLGIKYLEEAPARRARCSRGQYRAIRLCALAADQTLYRSSIQIAWPPPAGFPALRSGGQALQPAATIAIAAFAGPSR